MLAGIFAALAAYERELMALRAGGETISELVAGYGVSRATIYRALNHDADAIANS